MASLIMNFKQIFLLIKRSYTAAVIRVPFNGTTRFKLPHSYFLKGTKISLNAPSEPGLAYDFINLLLDDEYGLKSIKNHPKTIVDIGANIGLFSQMAGELFPEAKIHAYEPNPRLQKYLDQNLKKVGVEFFPEAVGAAFDRRLLYKIDFKKPEETVRKKILSNVFKDISTKTIDTLTEQFSLTGGQIANIKKKLLVKSVLDVNLDQESYLSTLCNEEFILSKSGRSTIGFIHS